MTIQWLWGACLLFIAGCFLIAFRRRRLWMPGFRVYAVHRESIHFAEPANFCTDCGGLLSWLSQSMTHAADCPRLTGERCPLCDKPKRMAHVCHYCGFAGFVIVFDFKFPPSESSSRLVHADPANRAASLPRANQAKDGSPLSCEDFEAERNPE